MHPPSVLAMLQTITAVLLLAVSGSASAAHPAAQAPQEKGSSMAALSITSTAFQNQGTIPSKFTCEGQDLSPALAFANLPAGTASLALIVDDPDAPDPKAPKMTWVHWVLFNIPPSVTGLPEAVASKDLPPGTQQGTNDWKRTGWGGPCPPIGKHRYFFKVYALDTVLGLDRPTKAELEAAMKGHVLAQAELVGTYQKQKH